MLDDASHSLSYGKDGRAEAPEEYSKLMKLYNEAVERRKKGIELDYWGNPRNLEAKINIDMTITKEPCSDNFDDTDSPGRADSCGAADWSRRP